MEIVLLEWVENLGQMGDVVKVKDGYARNYLLPQKKALRATKENLERFEAERAQLEVRNLERRKEAEAVAPKLDGLSLVVLRQASDSAQLYGSVSAHDIARAVSEAGFAIERRQVQLAAAIKTLGIHPIRVGLHPEVVVTVTVNVARSQEEVETQAKAGEAVKAAEPAVPEAAEEEVAVERFFEEEALAEVEKDIAAAGADEGPEEAETSDGDAAPEQSDGQAEA